MLKDLGVTGTRTLLVMPSSDRNVVLSGRNIQRTEVIQAADLNTYTVMKANRLIITEKAIQAINEQVEK